MDYKDTDDVKMRTKRVIHKPLGEFVTDVLITVILTASMIY